MTPSEMARKSHANRKARIREALVSNFPGLDQTAIDRLTYEVYRERLRSAGRLGGTPRRENAI